MCVAKNKAAPKRVRGLTLRGLIYCVRANFRSSVVKMRVTTSSMYSTEMSASDLWVARANDSCIRVVNMLRSAPFRSCTSNSCKTLSAVLCTISAAVSADLLISCDVSVMLPPRGSSCCFAVYNFFTKCLTTDKIQDCNNTYLQTNHSQKSRKTPKRQEQRLTDIWRERYQVNNERQHGNN